VVGVGKRARQGTCAVVESGEKGDISSQPSSSSSSSSSSSLDVDARIIDPPFTFAWK